LGFAVIFYLIGNEGVSLYNNWIKLGLSVPKFLSNIFNNLKNLSNLLVKRHDLENRINKKTGKGCD
jgi:phage-related holin